MTLVLGLALRRQLRSFGVGIVRVYVAWNRVAPAIQPVAPYNPSDPNDPRYKWGVYDRIVRAARTEGLLLDMTAHVTGDRFQAACRWAMTGDPISAIRTPSSGNRSRT